MSFMTVVPSPGPGGPTAAARAAAIGMSVYRGGRYTSPVSPLHPGATYLRVLEGGAGASPVTAASTGSIFSWVLRGGLVTGLATVIVLGTATPTGDLTITNHSSPTMTGPSPLPPPPPLPPEVTTYFVTPGSPPFYHHWTGQRGIDQDLYLSTYPQGDTIVTVWDPNSESSSVRREFRTWFGVLNETFNVEVIPFIGGTPEQYSLQRGFWAHAYAQLGSMVAGVESVPTFSALTMLPAPFYRRVEWDGLPHIVWKFDRPIFSHSDGFTHSIGWIGGEYIAKQDRINLDKDFPEILQDLFLANASFPGQEAYIIKWGVNAIPKLKKKKRKKMPCCSAVACKAILSRLKTIQKILDEYLKHDLKGYFPPICLEEGTKNLLTGEPIVDWNNQTAVNSLVNTIAGGGSAPGGVNVKEIYAGKGVAGIAKMIRAHNFQQSKTALGTDRGRGWWCEIESPEITNRLVASDVTEIRGIDLPHGDNIGILDLMIQVTDYAQHALRRFHPEEEYLSSLYPRWGWFGFISFLDEDYTESHKFAIDSSKMKFFLPFPSRKIVLRLEPSVKVKVFANGIFP